LRAQILAEVFLPGSRLPSVRTLMRKFDLSYGSAMRGIDELCEQGLLEKLPRRGILVRRAAGNPAPGGKGVIGVITQFPDFNEAHHGMAYHALMAIQKAAYDLNYPLLSIPVFGKFDQLESHPALKHCDALILLCEADNPQDRWTVSMPTVAMLTWDDFDGKISTVEIDPFHAAVQAVRYFQKYRVKEVSVVTDYRPVFHWRSEIFKECWKRAGGKIGTHYEYHAEKIPEIDFAQDLRTGYFFTSGHLFENCARTFTAATGRLLHTAIRALAVDGKNLIMPNFQPVPAIAMDWKWMGRTIFEELVALMENPLRMPRRIYLAGKLVEPNP
ncbi:MAG: winged helix-turn-helix domain-containing protein, partial [Victivallaceae bacterium]